MSIAFDHVSFGYSSDRLVLQDLNCSIADGEFVLIVGQNGAGKSTLLKLLNGILKPGRGTVTINSLDTKRAPTAELAAHVAVTFQNPADQIFATSVRDEIRFGPKTLRRTNAEQLTDECIEMFNLGSHADKHPYDLPPALRRLLTIASAVATAAPILAFDEPSASLSQTERSILLHALEELRRQKRTILVVSHDIDLFLPKMTGLVALNEGRMMYNGDPNEVIRNAQLARSCGLILPLALRLEKFVARQKGSTSQ